jgi:hypothetical protein
VKLSHSSSRVKALVKALLYRIAPRGTAALISARARAHSHRVVSGWGGRAVADKLLERFGDRVQEGPFAGLQLTRAACAEQVGPYLLGTYESELDEAWAVVFRGSYVQIVDIGAKFGYYAVGLARRYPDASVVAFDTDWWARKAVAGMAAANGTRNVEIKSFCSPEWLGSHLRPASLIVSDCEGYEAALFAPSVVASLRSVTLIIETHDQMVPGVTESLRRMFGDTHVVRAFGHGHVRRSTTRALDFLTDAERQLAVQEVRSPQIWLLCLPTTGPNQSLVSPGPIPEPRTPGSS